MCSDPSSPVKTQGLSVTLWVWIRSRVNGAQFPESQWSKASVLRIRGIALDDAVPLQLGEDEGARDQLMVLMKAATSKEGALGFAGCEFGQF